MSHNQTLLSPLPDTVTTEPTVPEVSIIIPAYSHLPKVLKCLASVLSTTNPMTVEVLVQDDCSPDYNLTETPLPPGSYPARNEQNLGFAGNCNAGAQRARGEFLLFVNQDIQATQVGWVDAMLAVFEKDEAVGVVGPRLVFPDGRVQSVGGLFDAGRGPYHRFFGWEDAFDRRVSITEKVSWTTGACLMIRTADFWECGWFRGDIYERGYFEDVHLCMEMTQRDKEIWYCAEATLVHEAGSTGGNPHFNQNSARFHQIWDKHIEPDSPYMFVNY